MTVVPLAVEVVLGEWRRLAPESRLVETGQSARTRGADLLFSGADVVVGCGGTGG
ncbi:hypothetical protein [Nocardia sp. BMG51109]|uniref:hypothetical protein n=1 Tax=Nocardia sp. BMG51109 TaxID=1056816 RepID=UPI0004BBD84E|nr:hypothetical protein [Nocardia sp. BMG51109]